MKRPMLLRLEQPPADQFAFPESIATGVEAVGSSGVVELKDTLTSTHWIAAGLALVSNAIAAPDALMVFARQDTSVEFLADPVDQQGGPGDHRRALTLPLAGS
jgi:hypothetical protein